jgi:ABC-2 type transport system permease protein
MTALVSAEILKLRTTRAWIGYLVALVALTGIGAAGTVGSARPRIGTPELTDDLMSAASFATVLAFVLGIVAMTSEWRHGTVTRTFLVTPRRSRVLVAKELFILVIGALLALVGLFVVLLVAVSWLEVEGSSLETSGLASQAARVIASSMLWGALGVGVGAIVHGQTPALVGSILWVLLGEALLVALLGLVDAEVVGDYLPGRALSAFDGSESGGLSMWPAGAVALGWVVGLAALGYLRISREDVT